MPKRKVELSPEERKRRSDLAKKLHQEGKIGQPNQGQGRPKTARASEYVAEQAAEKAKQVSDALFDALKSDSPSIKIKAALAILEVEQKEVKRRMEEEQKDFENATTEELIKFIVDKFGVLKDAGIVIPGFDIEGNAVEVAGQRPEGSSSEIAGVLGPTGSGQET